MFTTGKLVNAKLPSTGLKCERVAVTTTISGPSKSIRQVMNASGWCLVVTGDAKTPGDEYARLLDPVRHVYLSLSDQNKTGFGLATNTPVGHFSRKNLGYLYAVRMGAEMIFDFDDDNELLGDTLPSFEVTGPMAAYHLLKSDEVDEFDTVNPCSVGFQAKGMWPRGYPLSRINEPHASSLSKGTRSMELGVVQSMANHDPDVDAIYRLAPRASQPLPFTFQDSEQQLVLGNNVYAPFNAQATLFTRRGLWALFLPTTVHGRVSDILRSYIAQRLFWTVGLHISFHKPWVKQIRNSHDYLSDFMSERPLYEKTEELLRVLHQWRPRKGHEDNWAAIPQRLEDLYITLYEYEFVENDDISRVQLWLLDLLSIDYFAKQAGRSSAVPELPEQRPA